MKRTYNIMFCGVGGQGLMLLSAVLGRAAMKAGLRVITGEQHGLSQRQGSIYVHFRVGDPISPLIPYGHADMMISMEATETLRYIEYLKDDGVIIMSNRIIHPVTETQSVALDKSGSTKYLTVDQIVERLKEVTSNIVLLDSIGLANQAGNPRTENSVLIGAAVSCKDFPIPDQAVRDAISEIVPPKTIEVNLQAFELGKSSGRECLG